MLTFGAALTRSVLFLRKRCKGVRLRPMHHPIHLLCGLIDYQENVEGNSAHSDFVLESGSPRAVLKVLFVWL